MLQYCHSPHVVASEIHRVLRPGGLLYLDAPFVQPYCDHHGIDDLWRFTRTKLGRSPKVAGALYLVARKPATWSGPIASGTSAAALPEPSTAEPWAPGADRVDGARPGR
jgi:SAM-dependent methyltransferase